MEWIRELLPVILPVLVAGVTTFVFEKFQQLLGVLERAPAMVKQVAVVVLAFVLTKLSVFLGVTLTTADPTALTGPDFSALLSAGLAYLFHAGTKSKALAARVGA